MCKVKVVEPHDQQNTETHTCEYIKSIRDVVSRHTCLTSTTNIRWKRVLYRGSKSTRPAISVRHSSAAVRNAISGKYLVKSALETNHESYKHAHKITIQQHECRASFVRTRNRHSTALPGVINQHFLGTSLRAKGKSKSTLIYIYRYFVPWV